jgi:hypothetical protein
MIGGTSQFGAEVRFRREQEPAGELRLVEVLEIAEHVLKVDGIRRDRQDGQPGMPQCLC